MRCHFLIIGAHGDKPCTGHGDVEKAAGHGHSHGAEPCGGHGHGDGENKGANENISKLWRATAICFLFMIAEVVGGIIANSMAILTDAAHLLSDVAGMFISVAAIKIAQRVATQKYSFGYARAEVLGALMSCMLIWALTAILVYEAVNRMIHPEDVDGMVMTIVACLGLVVNLLMLFVLGGHSHGGQACSGHGHGEDGDLNVRAATIHVIGDLVQTIGVIIAASLIWGKPGDVGTWCCNSDGQRVSNWVYADPVCTCIFACLVLMTTYGIVKEAIMVLMQTTPPAADTESLAESLKAIPDVAEVHDIHVWAASPSNWVLTCHLVVAHEYNDATQKCCSTDELLEKAHKICTEWGAWHTTIQVEHLNGWACDTKCEPGRAAGRSDERPSSANSVDKKSNGDGHGHSHGGAPCGGH